MNNKLKKLSILTMSLLITGSMTYGLKNDLNVYAASDSERSEIVQSLSLIRNGNFNSGTTNWSFVNGELVTEGDNNVGKINTESVSGHCLQELNLTKGHKYQLDASVKVEAKNGKVPLGAFLTVKYGTVNSQGKKVSNETEIAFNESTDGWKQYKIEFTPESDSRIIAGIVKWVEKDIDNRCINTVISIDNMSLKEIENDDQYIVLWQDDFNNDTIDQNTWGYELGSVRGNEQQHYVDSKENVYTQDGKLILKVTDREKDGQYKNPRGNRQVIYNSGSIRTQGKKEFLYGRLEMKAKLPKGKGAFPAFWTLGADFVLDGDIKANQGYGWPSCGEIDIMEMIGAPNGLHENENTLGNQSNKTVYGTPHFFDRESNDGDKDGSYGGYNGQGGALGKSTSITSDFNDDYHVFGINWSPDKIEWYLDGEIYNTLVLSGNNRLEQAARDFNKPQYIQLNLATGGNWAQDAGQYLGTDNTQFEVDWVRWAQNKVQQKASQEYYQNSPQIIGHKDVTMIQGSVPDLLANIYVDMDNYYIDYSIEDEYMFINDGHGNTNTSLKCGGNSDKERLTDLTSGLYNIYYTAVPKDTEKEVIGNQEIIKRDKAYKLKRTVSKLLVLPEKIKGYKGEKLSSITLPKQWSWLNDDEIITDKTSYKICFTKDSRKTFADVSIDIKEKAVDKTLLSDKIDEANKLVKLTETYSMDSIQKLSQIIATANNVLNNPSVSQEIIDEQIHLLDSAIAKLEVLVPTPDPDSDIPPMPQPNPDSDVIPTPKPVPTPDPDLTPVPDLKPVVDNKNVQNVKTEDESLIIVFANLTIMSIIGISLLRSKRKANRKS